MKKTTHSRETAYLVAPQIADGFVPPVGFDYKISVSLHEVDVKIYGFDGQNWSLLHDTDGTIPSYIADIQHQKYYLESKTGSEQTVRVSFLSSEDEDSGIRTGGTPGNTRFYDIEEIPVYNGSRDGAMLTVMSDGSLAWLLVNESFIVPEEGGEENSAPTYSELTPVGDAAVVDGQIQTNGGYFSAPWSDFVSFTGDTPDNTDFTVAFWWKHGETPVAGVTPTFGLFNGRTNSMNEGMSYYILDHATSGVRLQTNFGPSYFANRTGLISEDPNVEHPWNHFVLTRTATHTKTYWNGVQVASHGANFPWVPNSATAQIQIGATDENGANSSQNTLFEDFEIRDGEAMSQADITTLFDAGRQSQGSGGGGNVIAGTFIEELTSASNNLSNGALITNNVFVKPANASVTLVSLDADGIVNFNADGTRTEEEMTLSMWFNPDSTSWTGWKYIAGNAVDSNNEFRLAISKDGSGNIEFKTILWDLWTGSPKGISSKPLAAGEWTHLGMTWSYNGSTYDLKLFVDGVKCGELLNQNRNLMKMASNRNFALGALAFGGSVTGSSLPCSMDSVQIKSGTALTDSQVAAIAGQSDRQMSIETAAQG